MDITRKSIKINTTILSDTLQTKINNHPLVIIVNELNEIYYLKTTSYKPNQVLKPYEVLIQPNQVLDHLSVVDTRKIYWINETEFNHKFKSKILTSDLTQKEVLKIYTKTNEFLSTQPPQVSLNKIKLNSNRKLDSYTIYSYVDILNDDLKTAIKITNYQNSKLDPTTQKLAIKKINDLYNEILEIRNHDDNNLEILEELNLYVENELSQLLNTYPENLINQVRKEVDDELSQLLNTYPENLINQVSKELKEERQKEKDDDDKDEY